MYLRSWQHLVYRVVHWLSNQFTLVIPIMLLSFYLFMTSEPPNSHCVKSISLRIQSECGRIWTRKNSVFGHFSRREWISKVSHGLAMLFILPYLPMIGFCINPSIFGSTFYTMLLFQFSQILILSFFYCLV